MGRLHDEHPLQRHDRMLRLPRFEGGQAGREIERRFAGMFRQLLLRQRPGGLWLTRLQLPMDFFVDGSRIRKLCEPYAQQDEPYTASIHPYSASAGGAGNHGEPSIERQRRVSDREIARAVPQ